MTHSLDFVLNSWLACPCASCVENRGMRKDYAWSCTGGGGMLMIPIDKIRDAFRPEGKCLFSSNATKLGRFEKEKSYA